jgi:DNA mismatch endonuclease (patch repair protein)
MRAIQSESTKPELLVRGLVHRMGYRYRVHRKDLPGKPDLVFVSRRKVIFVHGCFWHQHDEASCMDARLPRSNTEYWRPKLARNVERDAQSQSALRAKGWEFLVIWECETRNPKALRQRVNSFLGRRRGSVAE